ncbi:uncharacterized protein LOC133313642 [Gastrolobium bilobum]|uniref:uncharacterized protein LOC133313642 n=1 Tax=Gastrolobium bilobum TaxID=150636 RepID=UPI002AB1267B|nr:uncharacterized protein LOC133313642 [Gastrolobium bilobum]
MLHLRYEKDMMTFTGCYEGCNETEMGELTKMILACDSYNREFADHVASSFNHKIYVSNGGELNDRPHIQNLREFPREELFGKVVMVRFDSNILLKQKSYQKNQSVFNALFTIKYLYEAGAKVILVSDWNMNTSQLLQTESVAGDVIL